MRKDTVWSRWGTQGRMGLGALVLLCLAGCAQYAPRTMVVTAYSSDASSTNWRHDPVTGQTVVASGPYAGRPKAVGVTSSGKKVRRGTIAADTRYYPYGTVMKIPGYGKGVVEDTGTAIKGPERIDIYFPTRQQALQWGRQAVPVEVQR